MQEILNNEVINYRFFEIQNSLSEKYDRGTMSPIFCIQNDNGYEFTVKLKMFNSEEEKEYIVIINTDINLNVVNEIIS